MRRRERVLHFQRKLHDWASVDAERRFHDLWNLVCDPATLVVAWSRVSQQPRVTNGRGRRLHSPSTSSAARRGAVPLGSCASELKEGTLPAGAGP